MLKSLRSLPNTTRAVRGNAARSSSMRAIEFDLFKDSWRGSIYGCAVSLIALVPLVFLANQLTSPLQWAMVAGVALAVVVRTALWASLQEQKFSERSYGAWTRTFVLLALAEGLCWGALFAYTPISASTYPLLGAGLAIGLIGMAVISLVKLCVVLFAFCISFVVLLL
ncbi:MAG: hypothetical protein RL341_683, partial [Pseudomonadota bacterium]